MTLKPPASPYRPDPAAVARGKTIYMQACAACHGYQDGDHYVFKGEYLGKVEPNAKLGTDPARLNSYTERLRDYQVSELFKGTPYQFSHFREDRRLREHALGRPLAPRPLPARRQRADPGRPSEAADRAPRRLRARARHASIPRRAASRRRHAIRGAASPDAGFCFDTSRPGNGAGGHLYGTDLAPAAKADLLAYLLTF